MEKLKPLTKDITDAYVELGDRRCYLVPLAMRKTITNITDAISVGRIAAKMQEILDKINEIVERLDNNGLDTQGH